MCFFIWVFYFAPFFFAHTLLSGFLRYSVKVATPGHPRQVQRSELSECLVQLYISRKCGLSPCFVFSAYSGPLEIEILTGAKNLGVIRGCWACFPLSFLPFESLAQQKLAF